MSRLPLTEQSDIWNIFVTENSAGELLAVYPGRFHPFRKGHFHVYQYLVDKYNEERVYITTSEKVEFPKSPFTFDQKVVMMTTMGVPSDKIILARQPYIPSEFLDKFDAENTKLIMAVSDKDMNPGDPDEKPRFQFSGHVDLKKDGSMKYFQPYNNPRQPDEVFNAIDEFESLDVRGYIETVRTHEFDILCSRCRGATDIRALFVNSEEEARKEIITQLYNGWDEDVYNIFMDALVTEEIEV